MARRKLYPYIEKHGDLWYVVANIKGTGYGINYLILHRITRNKYKQFNCRMSELELFGSN